MTEYHIFKRLPGFLYELNELVGVVYSAKNIFGVGLMLNVLILRLIRGLEMAFLSQKSCFWDFWTLCACLFVAKIVYSDSAHGELSFGTKTGSLGPCVPILLPNLGLRADFGP